MTPPPANPLELIRRLIHEIREDRVPGLAAEVAFFTVLSLFPGLLIAAGVISYLDLLAGAEVAARTEEQLTEKLELVLADQASPIVASVEEVFRGSYGGLLTFASIGALATISGAWAVVIGALNLAYDTEERRSWLRRRLLGLGLGLVTVLVVALSLAVVVVGPLLGRGEEVADVVGLGSAFVWSWDVLRVPLLLVVVTTWLVFVFHHAPTRPTPWRASVPGAVATAVLWLAATLGFHLYLRVVGDRNPVLGAFGGGVVVLTWVYLLSIALLIGGELNALLHRRREPGDASSMEADHCRTDLKRTPQTDRGRSLRFGKRPLTR